MPKKKAVPDPASEQEMEPVSAVESAEDPSAAEAGMAEVAAALPDADAAVAPLEEGTPEPDATSLCPDQPEDAAYPLFAENAEISEFGTGEAKNRREMTSGSPSGQAKDIVRQEIVYKERPPRRITEIRIFFDDNTYETFKPEK